MEGMKDDRFSHISSDPRFKVAPKSVRKVKIDKRFQSLFTDKRFQVQYTVDKRGRHVNQSSQENFRKYYDISTDDDDSSEDSESSEEEYEKNKTNRDIKAKTQHTKSTGNENKLMNEENVSDATPYKSKTNKWVVTPSSEDQADDNCEAKHNNKSSLKTKEICSDNNKNIDIDTDKLEKARMTDEIKMKLRDPNIDYARGMGSLMSDSSSEEESSEDSESESESVEDHGWGELDRDAERTEDATDRIAVLHMDWDRIRAVDLMVLFNSFLPPEGVIESVTIYPSQFGIERMKEEEEKGPKELVNMKIEDESELGEESKEGKRYHMERLRQYQLNRLKYYYAIIKFDSAETAEKIYSECDGLEYESSATKLDLRFVPDEETFDQEPHEVCTSMPDPAKYEPRIFTNTALQQGKVELTWDEMDPERLEFTKKIQKNADKMDTADIQAFLASSSEEDDDDDADDNATNSDCESNQEDEKEEDRISRYKSLLASLEDEEEKKKNKDVDLEITWGVGLKEKAEKSIKEKLKTPQTPFEEMLEKRRQKKKLKRESKLKLKNNEKENDTDGDGSSEDDIPSDVDMNDPYFKEELQGFQKKKNKSKPIDEEDLQESKQKKAELELLLLDENDSETPKNHFNLKSIQEQEKTSKKKRRKQLKKKPQEVLPEKDDFEVNVNDDRFNALFTSHHFNIDPAESQFRNTKAMQAIHSEKLKRRHEELEQECSQEKQPKTDPELSLLVKSIKNKTKHKARR